MIRPIPSARRGYLLIELITVVALLGVFTIIIGATFTAAYRGQVDSNRREQRDHHVDAAMALLRRDTWNARRIDAAPNGLTLTDPAGNTILWTWADPWTRTMNSSHATTPTENEEKGGAAEIPSSTMHFPGLPTENVHAEIRGPSLLLHFGGKSSPPESIAFTSQVLPGAAP